MEVKRTGNITELYDDAYLKKLSSLETVGTNGIHGFAHLQDVLQEDDCLSVTLYKRDSTVTVPKGKILKLNNKPGEIIEQSDRTYMVQNDGSWKRIK